MNLRRSSLVEVDLAVTEPAATAGPLEEEPARPHSEQAPHAALDAVAAILRALRDAASADSEAAGELEAWARHVLVLAPPPGAPELLVRDRDWDGLCRHVVAHVRADRASTSQAIGELQDAVWLVVERFSRALIGDSAADSEAAGQLARLRAAADAPAAELKALALESVQRLTELINERSARQLELARELGQRVDRLTVELEDTRREADIDPLTKLCNRGVFQRELPRVLQVHTLAGEPASLVLVDIDGFKQINDAQGHACGDLTLASVAGALARCFPRRADVVTRLGGDEFAVILRDAALDDATRLAERFLAAVRSLAGDGQSCGTAATVSAGVAEALAGEAADAWFARADRALYEAKATGRDRVVVSADRSRAAAA